MEYIYMAKVKRVIDGDTFEFTMDLGFEIYANMIFRLRGIDTPETWRPKTEAEREHGEQATALVKEAIENKVVLVKTYKADKYGRYLCDVIFDNGLNLASYLEIKGMSKKEEYEDGD